MAKKPFLTAVFTATTLTLAGCSGAGAPSGEAASAPADPGSVSGDITVLTQRTDLVQDGTMKKYAAAFNKVYPKVKVKFQGITDYEGEVKIRMNTENYGDVLMIPAAISKDDYPKFFAPLGSTTQLSKKYRFTDKTGVNGKVYGIASFGTANGFVYNKAVWKKAGVTQWPATPEQFIADLGKIKAATDSVPYYTNFKDLWPLTAWTNSLGSVSCDPQSSNKLATTDSPWAPGSDLNVIDTLLYDIVHDKLSEKDPTTTNWESSKTLIAQGKVASMQLGSWAITQMQDAARKAAPTRTTSASCPSPPRRTASSAPPCCPTTSRLSTLTPSTRLRPAPGSTGSPTSPGTRRTKGPYQPSNPRPCRTRSRPTPPPAFCSWSAPRRTPGKSTPSTTPRR